MYFMHQIYIIIRVIPNSNADILLTVNNLCIYKQEGLLDSLTAAFRYISIPIVTLPPSPLSTISSSVFNVMLLPSFSTLEI